MDINLAAESVLFFITSLKRYLYETNNTHLVCVNIFFQIFKKSRSDLHTKFSFMIEIINFETFYLRFIVKYFLAPCMHNFTAFYKIHRVVCSARISKWFMWLRLGLCCINVAKQHEIKIKSFPAKLTGHGHMAAKVMPNPLYPYCNIFHLQ